MNASGTSHHNGAEHKAGVGERVTELNDSAQKLISDAKSAVTDLTASMDLKGRVEKHPYGMVAAAIGVGYLLGGGLFTPLTGRVVRLGLRLAALPFVKEELLGMAESALDGITGATGAVAQGSSRSSSQS